MDQATIIERIRARGITTSDISDDELGTLITSALNWYSYYRPAVKLTTTSSCITTVADQQAYDPPSDALWVVEVFWNPTGQYAIQDLYRALLGVQFDPDHYADVVINLSQLARINSYFRGRWKVVDGKIYLIPTPAEDGVKVPVLYATAKTLSDLDEVKDIWFEELVYAMALERKALNMTSQAGWRAGAYQVSAQPAVVMAKWAQQRIQEVRQAIANNYAAARSDSRGGGHEET
ncbi:MAG: hypothetical protein JRD89_00060 [Deltaproteobacteria bacterium]|nr:hypothetical protein [Deltaproteobacteria bacterium]